MHLKFQNDNKTFYNHWIWDAAIVMYNPLITVQYSSVDEVKACTGKMTKTFVDNMVEAPTNLNEPMFKIFFPRTNSISLIWLIDFNAELKFLPIRCSRRHMIINKIIEKDTTNN